MQQRISLVDKVYDWLSDQCAGRRFEAGSHLHAVRLAEELSVSTTTMRKALERAVDAGWVERKSNGRPTLVVCPPQRRRQPTDFSPGDDQVALVHQHVSEQLLSGALQPGATINAKRLADELGVAMSAVRRALEGIASRGLLHRRPRRGWRVTTLSVAELNDIFRIRGLLETAIVRHCVQTASREEIEELRARNSSVKETNGQLRYGIRKADYEFHSTLAELSGHRILAGTLDPLLQMLFINPGVRSPQESFAEHAAIIDAIAERDADRAAEAMQIHLRISGRRYLEGGVLNDE